MSGRQPYQPDPNKHHPGRRRQLPERDTNENRGVDPADRAFPAAPIQPAILLPPSNIPGAGIFTSVSSTADTRPFTSGPFSSTANNSWRPHNGPGPSSASGSWIANQGMRMENNGGSGSGPPLFAPPRPAFLNNSVHGDGYGNEQYGNIQPSTGSSSSQIPMNPTGHPQQLHPSNNRPSWLQSLNTQPFHHLANQQNGPSHSRPASSSSTQPHSDQSFHHSSTTQSVPSQSPPASSQPPPSRESQPFHPLSARQQLDPSHSRPAWCPSSQPMLRPDSQQLNSSSAREVSNLAPSSFLRQDQPPEGRSEGRREERREETLEEERQRLNETFSGMMPARRQNVDPRRRSIVLDSRDSQASTDREHRSDDRREHPSSPPAVIQVPRFFFQESREAEINREARRLRAEAMAKKRVAQAAEDEENRLLTPPSPFKSPVKKMPPKPKNPVLPADQLPSISSLARIPKKKAPGAARESAATSSSSSSRQAPETPTNKSTSGSVEKKKRAAGEDAESERKKKKKKKQDEEEGEGPGSSKKSSEKKKKRKSK